MDVKITQKQKNPVFHREEITFEVRESKATPTRKELREKIAALTGAKPELVIIEKISTRFGSTFVGGKALAYEEEKGMQKTELGHLINKSAGIKKSKEEKAKAPPAPAPKK
ncbi:MAG: 30S ribosomal protein S24e [Candidatus ainarchaeum sp.]|nr:30S ribosomal protein S24e [Candidatus ainarchaeum sp.]